MTSLARWSSSFLFFSARNKGARKLAKYIGEKTEHCITSTYDSEFTENSNFIAIKYSLRSMSLFHLPVCEKDQKHLVISIKAPLMEEELFLWRISVCPEVREGNWWKKQCPSILLGMIFQILFSVFRVSKKGNIIIRMRVVNLMIRQP